MPLEYTIDERLPRTVAKDLVVQFERIFERCPSDSKLFFSALSAGGRLCLDVTLNSATMRFRETLESPSYRAIKRGVKKIFKSRIEGWRRGVVQEPEA
jgi:hypothetical protein